MLAAAVSSGIALLAISGARATSAAGRGRDTGAAAAAASDAAALRGVQIAFYADRAARDTLSAADRSRLAALFLDRARETGSSADLERSEAMARASLHLRQAHNAGSYVILASSLMAQHRFAEALTAATRADAMEPGVATHRALVGEIALELGRYETARTIFGALEREPLSDVGLLRLARWYEISGRPERAVSVLTGVMREWERVPNVAPAHLAWIQLRLAELAMKEGRLAAADSALSAGLRVAPADYRLLGGAARLAARRGRWTKAIDFGERAIAVSMEPTTLGVLSDAYAARGDSARAAELAEIMRVVAFQENTPSRPHALTPSRGFPHRAWSLWMLDHGIEIATVTRLAREELRDRGDVYGYDLYAWALHKSGQSARAREAMRQALRMGTRDKMLERHALEIGVTPGPPGLR